MEKLRELFEEINLTVFCEKYGFKYGYVQKVFKGKYELSVKLEYELLEAYGRYLEAKQKIYHS